MSYYLKKVEKSILGGSIKMKINKIKLGAIFVASILILIIGSSAMTLAINTNVKTWYVDDDGGKDFRNIQDAVDAASDGDTIFVYSGNYYESVNVSKSLNIYGENKETTLVFYNESYSVFNVTKDNTEINGFTIEQQLYSYYSAIQILSNYSIISDNIIRYSGYGAGRGLEITMGKTQNKIQRNNFFNSGLVFGWGKIGNNLIEENIVNDKPLFYLKGQSNKVVEYPQGQIILLDCNDITIKNQEIRETSNGIAIVDCKDCTITGCSIQDNYYGMSIEDSENIKITRSRIESNDYGLYISSLNTFAITNNTISANTLWAIMLENTEDGTIESNNLIYNIYCLMMVSSDLNVITRNNFDSNLQNVYSLFSALNTWNGNYWDRPRFFPKLILEFPRINFDWYPAKQPYDINV